MRLAVLGEGYASATEAFVSGGQVATDASTVLRDRLAGFGGMAGDDATATDFADSYDAAAGEAAWSVAELAGACGSMARLSAGSMANHHAAEVASGGEPPWRPLAPPGLIELMRTVPPSALGADSDFLPGWASVVLDLLEGAVWPDADTDRLREAAMVWRAAARSVGLLGAHCETALAGLDDEVSPEIPLAIATTRDLRDRVATLADQLVAIGDACEAYADQVDAKREQMLDLLEEVGKELAAGAIIAGGLSLISGGLAAGVASGAASGRVATASRELKLIVDALRVLNGSTAATLRPVATTVRETRSSLARLLRAELARADERGVASLGEWGRFTHGWLRDHEAAGGHAIRKHVGKTDEYLRTRLMNDGGPPAASTFRTQAEAERAVQHALAMRRDDIATWLESGRRKRSFVADLQQDIGRILIRETGEIVTGSKVRIVLVREPFMPRGWRLQTAFPDL